MTTKKMISSMHWTTDPKCKKKNSLVVHINWNKISVKKSFDQNRKTICRLRIPVEFFTIVILHQDGGELSG